MDKLSKPLQNPAVLTRKVLAEEMVLVNADSAVSLALTNLTAVMVWEMADGKNTVEDIINRISQYFQSVPDTVGKDILDLLHLLARDGFVGFEWSGQL